MSRPKVPLISRERAVEAALQIVDEDGLGALTLERIGSTLGVRAPSLYHHFGAKTDILTAAARALLITIPLPAEPPVEDWQDWFVEMSLRTYRHVIARPRAAKLLVEHFPKTLVFPAHEVGSRILLNAGVPTEAVATVIRGIEKHNFGLILADAEELLDGDEHEVPASRWPTLRSVLDANHWDSEEMFLRSVQVYMAGVEACYLARSPVSSTGRFRRTRRRTA